MNDEQKIDWTRATDDELVRAFQQCDAAKDRMNDKVRTIDATVDDIKSEMLARMVQRKQEGFRTTTANVSRTKTMKVSCASEAWPLFYKWLVRELVRLVQAGADPTQIFSYLHKRVTKETIESYMAANDGHVPPGINILPEYAVSVKKRTEAAQRRAA
jgi:hypothetical protein